MNLLHNKTGSVALWCLLITFFVPATTAATISVHKKFHKVKALEKKALLAKESKQMLLSKTVSIDATRDDINLIEPVNNSDFSNKYLPIFGVNGDSEIRTSSLSTRGLGNFTNAIGLRSSNLIVFDREVLPRRSMLNTAIADVAKVEALRGPQGTLFGQNASTGVIQYETRRPKLDTFIGRISVQATEYEGLETKAAVNLPVGEQWAVRMNAQRSEVGGWIRNEYPGGEDIGAGLSEGLRGQLLFAGDPHFNVLLRMEYSESMSNCCASVIDELVPDFGPTPIVRIDNGVVSASSYNMIDPEPSFKEFGIPVASKNTAVSFQKIENFGVSAELNYTLANGIPLSYIASFRDFEIHGNSGSSSFKFPLEREIRAGTEGVGVVQQELNLSSIGENLWSWVVGVFFHDTVGSRSEVTDGCIGGAGASSRGVIEDGVLVACVSKDSALAFIDDYQQKGRQDRTLLQADRNLSSAQYTSNFTNTAVYGQVGYQISPQIDATLGFRALYEKGSAGFTSLWLRPPEEGSGLENYAEVKAMANDDMSLVRRDSISANFADTNFDLTYKSVLGYQFSDAIRGYVNYSTGYKGPSFHVTSNSNLQQPEYFPTRPEKSTNFEVGLKTTLFSNRMFFDVTYFDMAIKDYQVQTQLLADESSATYGGFINADKVRSSGVEADMVYKFADNLKLIGSYALYDAVYDTFSSTKVNCPGGNLQYRCSVVDGKQVFDQSGLALPNNAEEQLRMTINYRRKLGRTDWSADIRSVWRYESEKTPNTSLLVENAAPNPAFDVLDLYLGLGNAKLRFNFFLKNLLNHRYTTNKSVSSGGDRVAYAYPRDYQRYLGGSASYNF
ncbi:Vitamin B12 transporter BtuB [Zhongshania aliphaticivorans]|uniref:Vitamin B12 transporter BtuB n=1 Tax=Zhongshania aliphaticivorans TaxID=1470434 RepID=A0A5S9P1Z2_9GAMM|nr:TonB-dependent receptor [Zhongshania aliphaticivorans]CAA0089963.1 Vitamin B12 transporter BtuB [Zhongshania aliphaticivorans]CAA0097127.1 Vitamin B12 transporter BtuB [Zhongshania aliphaticivorans]